MNYLGQKIEKNQILQYNQARGSSLIPLISIEKNQILQYYQATSSGQQREKR